MFLSQQVKRNVIINNKIAKYKLTNELPNDIRLKKNIKTPRNCGLVSSPLPKMKILSILYFSSTLEMPLVTRS